MEGSQVILRSAHLKVAVHSAAQLVEFCMSMYIVTVKPGRWSQESEGGQSFIECGKVEGDSSPHMK
jgi:hypothetical protein